MKRSLWQDEALPFSDALTAVQMEQAFAAEEVSFGGDSRGSEEASIEDGGLVYTRGVTLWAMRSQALFTDVQRACRAAVRRVAVCYALLGTRISSTNTGA